MTAVEWLQEQYIKLESTLDAYNMYALFEQAKEMEKWQRMKFEIPELSDEEIELKSKEYAYFNPDNDKTIHFYEGAKWYREQIKQRQ